MITGYHTVGIEEVRQEIQRGQAAKMVASRTVALSIEAAEYLFSLNKDNYRQYRKATVAEYAQMMRDGLWQDGVATIKVDWQGRLTNGQHTLGAILLSGRLIVVNLVVGVAPETADVEDSNLPRRSIDARRRHNLPRDAESVLRLWLAWKAGLRKSTVPKLHPAQLMPSYERDEFFQKNLEKALTTARTLRTAAIISVPIAAVTYLAICEIDSEHVNDYFLGIAGTISTPEMTDPRVFIRRTLQASPVIRVGTPHGQLKRAPGARQEHIEKALIISGFNLWRQGKLSPYAFDAKPDTCFFPDGSDLPEELILPEVYRAP